MVHCRDRNPGVGTVAVLADVGRLHMRRTLAGGVGAIVTTNAIVDDVGVVKVGGSPGDRCMTVIAIDTTRDMSRVLASCRNTVMTGAASANHLRVVDGECRYPDV